MPTITRSKNFQATFVSPDFGAANSECAVEHGLQNALGQGIIPRGFIVTKRVTPCYIYDSGTPWTATTAYLKADVNSASVVVMFFV